MIVVYVFSVLIGTAWIWRMLQEKRVIFTKTPLFVPILFYIASQAVSTVFSLHPNTSIFGYYSRFHGGLLSTLSYSLLYFAMSSNFNKNDLKKLIPFSLFAAIGVALYAIPEHFGVSPSCVLITNEFTVSCWVQDVKTRVFATFGQPNWLAAYFLMLIPLAFWLFTSEWEKKKSTLLQKSWSVVALVLFTMALLYTRSRSGFLALLAEGALLVIAAAAISLLSWLQQQTLHRKMLVPICAALLPFFIALLLGSPYSPSLTEMIKKALPAPTQVQQESASAPESPSAPAPSTTSLETGGTDSSAIRAVVWKGAFDVWKRYPLFGSGVETFAYSYYKDRPQEHNNNSEWDFLYNRAHNEYLNALATTGLVGFFALIVLNISVLSLFVWEAWNALQNKNLETYWLAIALAAGYGSSIITNFFGFSTVMIGVLSFLFPAFLLAWKTPAEAENKKVAPAKKHLHKTQDAIELNLDGETFLFGLSGLVAFFFLIVIWGMWNNDRQMALAKRYFSEGQALKSYEIYESLTRSAPHEAVFWNEKSVLLAQLAVATKEEDPTVASQLAKQAEDASNTTVELNPAQVNFWKSRARVFILLSALDTNQAVKALESLKVAEEKAPTDAKIIYNQALIYDSLGKAPEADIAFQKAIDLRPRYEEARQSYAKFLENTNQLEKAVEQYQYVIENLNPGDTTTRKHLEELTATMSAKRV